MPSSDVTERDEFEQTLRVLRRRWKLIVLCTVLVAGAAVAFSLHHQKQYTASASLLFSNNQFNAEIFGSSSAPSPPDPATQQANNIYLASLPTVAARTARALHLSPGLVSSDVSVSQAGQTNVANISVSDANPVRAASIANTYAAQYVLSRQESFRVQITAAQKLVAQQISQLTPTQRSNTAVGQDLMNRANQLSLLAALQTGDAEVVQNASVPTSPSPTKTKRNLVVGGLFGLLLGITLAVMLERLDHRLREPSELEHVYSAPVLSIVPQSRALAKFEVPARDMESFALLRSRLRYFNVDRRVDSLLVTSALSGEGKSTVALNLAVAEALAGNRNVLLFELDLRRPCLGKRLGIAAVPGTAEVLSGNASLEDALTRVEMPHGTNGRAPTSGFTLLPSGAIPPNPVELLSSHALIELLEALTRRFSLVVIDSPSLTLVSDAMPLVQRVSAVLVVLRMGHTTTSAARRGAEQLANLKAPTLGVVANAMPAKDRARYLGGSGYSSYGYPHEDEALADGVKPVVAKDVPHAAAFEDDLRRRREVQGVGYRRWAGWRKQGEPEFHEELLKEVESEAGGGEDDDALHPDANPEQTTTADWSHQ
jgi:capsular exopolysaccharide synthesis family protein